MFRQIWSQIEKCLVLIDIWHKYKKNHAEYWDIIFLQYLLTAVIFGQIWLQIENYLILYEIWHKHQINHSEYADGIIFS